jgi:hypothetical protein
MLCGQCMARVVPSPPRSARRDHYSTDYSTEQLSTSPVHSKSLIELDSKKKTIAYRYGEQYQSTPWTGSLTYHCKALHSSATAEHATSCKRTRICRGKVFLS